MIDLEVGARVIVVDRYGPDSEEGEVLALNAEEELVLVAFGQGIKLWCAADTVEAQS